MLSIDDYRLLAKDYAKGIFESDLDFAIWLSKWYSRTYGISLSDAQELTIHDLLIEFLAKPYFDEPSLLNKDEEDRQQEAITKSDAAWAEKLVAKQENVDPRIQEMLKKQMQAEKEMSVEDKQKIQKEADNFQPVSFGE